MLRWRVDPVLAPDQFSVLQPLAPEDLDRCVTWYGIYPLLPTPNGVPWSEYVRSQGNMSRSVSSSTEALDSNHVRFITNRIAQHARAMAASTRSLPTNSPVPYFEPVERGHVSEGRLSDMGSIDITFAPGMQMSSWSVNLPRAVGLPEGMVHHPVEESDQLMTYTGLDDYDTVFEARHGRAALDHVSKKSAEKFTSSRGITPTTLETGLMVWSKDKEKPIIGIEPMSQDDHVSMMTDPLTNRVVLPNSEIIDEGAVIFTNMTETMLAALNQQLAMSADIQELKEPLNDDNVTVRQLMKENLMKRTQGRTQMVPDPKEVYPDLFLPVIEKHQISDWFCGYLDSLSTDNNPWCW